MYSHLMVQVPNGVGHLVASVHNAMSTAETAATLLLKSVMRALERPRPGKRTHTNLIPLNLPRILLELSSIPVPLKVHRGLH